MMKFGTAYLGSHRRDVLRAELGDIGKQGFDSVVLTCQENDFIHFPGKITETPKIAHDLGVRVLINLWGYACAFGGGRISRLLSDEPEVMATNRDGSLYTVTWPGLRMHVGCTNQPRLYERARELAAAAISAGADGFFWDEPTKIDCYCDACRRVFGERRNADLLTATDAERAAFRRWSVSHWVDEMSGWVKKQKVSLETSTCVMPSDRDAWEEVARVENLDSLGTDTYWLLEKKPIEWMSEPCRSLVSTARAHGKIPHLWLQCWRVPAGREEELVEASRELAAAGPERIYVWAYDGQAGTEEACDDPGKAWRFALEGLRAAGMKSRQG